MSGSGKPAIVVGADGSGWSEAALDWAADEASRLRASVLVVHAFQWPVMGVPLTGVPARYDPRETARRMVAEAVARVRSAGVPVEGKVESGAPAACLLAAGRGAAAIVVGNRGLGGFTGLLAGSVSVQLAEHAPCPVVVVRPNAAIPADAPVVLGVDPPGSDRAACWAFAEAARRDVPLIAVHAWPVAVGAPPDLGDPDEESEAERIYEMLRRWHKEFPAVRLDGYDARGHPAAVLIDRAADAQLAVVGARGRGGFRGLLLGSTSQALVRHAPCPVAVVPDTSDSAG